MTARVLNSSKMRSLSSGLCSSAKEVTACCGGAMMEVAASMLCCSSLQVALWVKLYGAAAQLLAQAS